MIYGMSDTWNNDEGVLNGAYVRFFSSNFNLLASLLCARRLITSKTYKKINQIMLCLL